MPVTSYSTTAASNNGAPPNGSPEGCAPSSLNDTLRQVMADIALEAQTNNVKVLKSVSGTNTITADMDPELSAYVAGMIVIFTPANTNTGATTIAIDGLTALDIQKGSGSALTGNELVAGIPAMLILDSGADDFIFVNPQSGSSSYIGTLTGCTTSPTTTITYIVNSGFVYLKISAIGTATSNATSMSLTGMPANIRPSLQINNMSIPVLINNGASIYTGPTLSVLTNGDIVFNINGTGAFTGSGSKGFATDLSVIYPL